MEETRKLAEYLECGKIINTHGVRGEVKLESYCDSPDVLKNLSVVYLKEGGEYRGIAVRHASIFKSFVLMSLSGVDTLDDAIALKNRTVYAARGDLPIEEGAYFIADLIGLPVIDADNGKYYGTLVNVTNLGASDLYTVKTENGERMMPAVKEFVDRVVLSEAIYIRPIAGMLD